MARYILRNEKKVEWEAIYEKLKGTTSDIHPATLEKIRTQKPINGKTVGRIIQNIRRELPDRNEPNLRETLFEVFQSEVKETSLDEVKVSAVLNKSRSENIRDWIIRMRKKHDYDCLDLFTYTNETLHAFIKTLEMHVRSLARNWVEERIAEESYNAKSARKEDRRAWEKAQMAQMGAEIIANEATTYSLSLEQRYYKGEPFIKGAILRNSKTGRKAVYYGLYKWDPEREGGGSPFQGVTWGGYKLTDEDETKAVIIETLLSRFERLWETSDTYDSVREQQEAFERKASARNYWEIDSRPYKIVIPGLSWNRGDKEYGYPDVNYPDARAAEKIGRFLTRYEVNVQIEIMTLNHFLKEGDSEQEHIKALEKERCAWYKNNIKPFEGHVIFLCSRTLTEATREHMRASGFPFEIVRKTGHPDKIRDCNSGLVYRSPIDYEDEDEKHIFADFCILGKCSRPKDEPAGKFFLVSGIHALGTLGGSVFVADEENLHKISSSLGLGRDPRSNLGLMVRTVSQSVQGTNVKATIFEEPICFTDASESDEEVQSE